MIEGQGFDGIDFEKIDEEPSTLIITHGGRIQSVISDIVKYYVDKGEFGIYLSLNKPHKTVESILRHAGVSGEHLFFIDCITASVNTIGVLDSESVAYLNDFDDISQKMKIMDAVDKFAFSVPGDKFMIVDALRTILIYHEPDVVSKLIKDLIYELRDAGVRFIVLTRSEDDSEVIKTIS
ncbi:MAG: hypothetical protein ABH851_03435, partial [Methanobacteriota archaeon]